MSREAIQIASKKDKRKAVKWFVTDLSKIPLKDGSMDCILDIFSPAHYKEFQRLLSPNEKPEVPETPSTPDVPQSHEETKVSDAPKTGDNTNIWLPILLLLISTGGMAGLYISRKKIRKQ